MLQDTCGVGPETALHVADAQSCLHEHPELGKLSAETGTSRHIGDAEIPGADDDGPGSLLDGIKKVRDVLRLVLAVGIHGDDMGIAQGRSCCRATPYGRPLAPVPLVMNKVYGQVGDAFWPVIRAAVIHHDDIGMLS